MKTIKVICVSEDGILHQLIGGAVKIVTHSDIAHVAMRFEHTIIEALAPKIQEHTELDRYANEPVLRCMKSRLRMSNTMQFIKKLGHG